jgi:hypothetical protein
MDLIQVTWKLLNLHDQNLPISKERRYARLESVSKMKKLIRTMIRTRPQLPRELTSLDPNDPEWEDKMIYPSMEHGKFLGQGLLWMGLQGFFIYNYP